MVNPFLEVNWNPGHEERRKFAWSILIGFPCLATLFFIVGRMRTGAWSLNGPLKLAGVGAAAGLIFLMLPAIVKPFYVAWYAVACCIGLVVGNLALAAAFLLLVTPIGFLKRISGGSAIRKTVDRSAKSYWQDVKQPADPAQYFRQF